MSHAQESKTQPRRIRATLAQVRAYQQNEYEVALYRHLEKETEKQRRERRRRLDLPVQSNHSSQQIGSQSDQKAKRPANLSAAAAAALAAERRAAAAARRAADKVALVPWNADSLAVTVFESNGRRSSSSPPLLRQSSGPSNSPTPDRVQLQPKRCISPRMLRLAREFTLEAREYDRRRQRMQRMNALANGQQNHAGFQISRARAPRTTVHRPSTLSPSSTDQVKRHRREVAGGHRLGDFTDMEGNPNLESVPWVHRRHAEASTRICGRAPTATRNSPTGSTASIINDSQAVPLRSHRRIQPRPVYVPHFISPPHNCSRAPATQPAKPSKQKSCGGTWQMLAARHAARNNRKTHVCTHCPTVNRTLPRPSETVEITQIENEDEAPVPGAPRSFGPLNSEINPSNQPPTSEQSTEPQPSRPPRVTARYAAQSTSIPMTSQPPVDRPSATAARTSSARRRPQPTLTRH